MIKCSFSVYNNRETTAEDPFDRIDYVSCCKSLWFKYLNVTEASHVN